METITEPPAILEWNGKTYRQLAKGEMRRRGDIFEDGSPCHLVDVKQGNFITCCAVYRAQEEVRRAAVQEKTGLPRSVTIPIVNRGDVVVWDGASKAVRENFQARGAVGVLVSVFSYTDNRRLQWVILDSEVFQHVVLSLEQVQLILTHLHAPTTTETVFVMAQAIEAGVDLDLVYDSATGITHTPRAARKVGAA